MSRQNATRRNRALRKIRASRHLPQNIKAAIEAVLDLLNCRSGYNVAWPSAETIATRVGRKRRMGLRYVKVIKALGIFHWEQLSPKEAREFLDQRYGIETRFDQCRHQAPNIFIVNDSHPLWDNTRSLPESVDEDMGRIAREVLRKDNRKTTSRLSSDTTKRPLTRRYSAKVFRERLAQFLSEAKEDSNAAELLQGLDAERWCREKPSSDVANDTIDDVANDTQVFRKRIEQPNESGLQSFKLNAESALC